MVIFFGPPGAGKSVQGQLLAARHGWRWLSTGQLLRDTKDERLHQVMKRGDLVSDEDMNTIIGEALMHASDISDVVLDGFPRKVDQASWLVEHLDSFKRHIDVIVSLEVSDKELFDRLHIRGRSDDTPQNITKRSQVYHEKTEPVIDYFKKQNIHVERINGEGSVGTVHDRVEKAIQSWLTA